LFIERQVQLAIDILKRGGIVAFPTDTVYGLGASSLIGPAVERIYRVKRRPGNLPLPLLLSDISQMEGVAEAIPQIAWILARRFLPGGLTLILPKATSVPGFIAPGGTVAVRIPNHPIPLEIVRGLGSPITGTSANLSGRPSALTADEVGAQLGDSVDFIIDGGRCPGGVESTVVDLTAEPPAILREGAIPRKVLEKLIHQLTRRSVYKEEGKECISS
jgi:L-threonylcarbamoyladenylate synthase